MPGQTMTNDTIVSEGELASIILLNRHASNFPLNIFLYTHRLVQLSTFIREASLGSARLL